MHATVCVPAHAKTGDEDARARKKTAAVPFHARASVIKHAGSGDGRPRRAGSSPGVGRGSPVLRSLAAFPILPRGPPILVPTVLVARGRAQKLVRAAALGRQIRAGRRRFHRAWPPPPVCAEELFGRTPHSASRSATAAPRTAQAISDRPPRSHGCAAPPHALPKVWLRCTGKEKSGYSKRPNRAVQGPERRWVVRAGASMGCIGSQIHARGKRGGGWGRVPPGGVACGSQTYIAGRDSRAGGMGWDAVMH